MSNGQNCPDIIMKKQALLKQLHFFKEFKKQNGFIDCKYLSCGMTNKAIKSNELEEKSKLYNRGPLQTLLNVCKLKIQLFRSRQN